jgi:hypothetical protein
MATRIDTLRTYEAIAAAGVDDKAARAISNAIAEAASDWRADLATKSDLDVVMAATKADIETLRLSTKADIEALRAGTKSDIEALRAGTKSDIEALRTGTKSDIEALRTGTKSDLAVLKAELETAISNTQNKTLVWMFGMLVVFSGVIMSGIKLM